MTTDDRVQQFLKSEEEASRLVDELANLRKETNAYAAAQEALDEAAKDLGALIERLADLAGGVKDVTATLKEIGTPALLSGQQDLDKRMQTIRDEVRFMRMALGVAILLIVLLGAGGLILGFS